MVKGSPRNHCLLVERVRLGLKSLCRTQLIESVLCSQMPCLPHGKYPALSLALCIVGPFSDVCLVESSVSCYF